MIKLDLSILADSTCDFLVNKLIEISKESDVDLELNIRNYPIDQIELNLLNQHSDIYTNASDVVVIYESSEKLLGMFFDFENKSKFADHIFETKKTELDNLIQFTSSKIILFNYVEINDLVFGNFSAKTKDSFIFQIRKLNYLISEYVLDLSRLSVLDLSTIQNREGRNTLLNPSLFFNYSLNLSIDVFTLVAEQLFTILKTQLGLFNKCLILDLDNTLWGGVIGDDGIENIQLGNLGIGKTFSHLQSWAKQLKERGVIICICSKNFENIAKEVFENHPDMKIRLNDISVFVCNWESKVENIKKIQKILNISFDSMVFIDDNPFERNLVRQSLDGITVPELPEDPALYLPFLIQQNLFETFVNQQTNLDRTKLYQSEQKRIEERSEHKDLNSFLQGIGMTSKFSSLNEFNIPRVSQLSMRSNQFNTRTIRYTKDELAHLSSDPNYFSLIFELEDKFGSHGIVSFVMLKKQSSKEVFIENWAMSCRVLNRTMEQFIMNQLVQLCKENSIERLNAEFIASPKNKLVQNLYPDLTFLSTKPNKYKVDIFEFSPLKNYITKVQ